VVLVNSQISGRNQGPNGEMNRENYRAATREFAELSARCGLDYGSPRILRKLSRFEYKTVGFYWAKLNRSAKHDADYFTGLGYWTRANPEQCLLATRGKPSRKARDVRRLVVEKRREHCRKPDCVRERIERLVEGPYLELFARQTKPGWDCFGDQISLFDRGSVPTRRQPSRLVDAPHALVSPATMKGRDAEARRRGSNAIGDDHFLNLHNR